MANLDYRVDFTAGEDFIQCDAYRLGYSEKEILLDFGILERDPASREIEAVKIKTRIALPIDVLSQLIFALFLSGREYEAEYKRDIGLSGIE